ncbi:uncharacterized protein LOC116254751 isoform X1 [Nymphaea colorata]|nr:uncharacterized protein LOC116254751 isoform X1 [Nymphaea colorata]
MPTFTTIALENLLAPAVTQSTMQRGPKSTSPNGFPQNGLKKSSICDEKRPPQHLFFSPALYRTPEQTPVPDSPSSFSQSPYILDYKRRKPRLQTEGILVHRIEEPAGYGGEVALGNGEPDSMEEVQTEVLRRCSDGGGDDLWKNVEISVDEGAETGRFLDPRVPNVVVIDRREEMEEDDGRTPYCQSEFFDASDDFWRDGLSSQGSPFYRSSLQADLDFLKMDLLLETERRKRAEEAVQNMHEQWERISKQLSQIGLSLPMLDESSNLVQEDEGGYALSQEVAIARFVAEAIGRGQARAEAEARAEAVINAKNVEIARLHDKLQYYETVNREITQRNLQNIEATRRLKRWRKRRKRLVWGCVGLSFVIGACFLTYSYLPHGATKPSLATAKQSSAGSSKPESITKS